MIKPSASFSSSTTSTTSRSLKSAGGSDTSSVRRELLFGEIDNTGAPPLRSNNTVCNLILSSNSKFLRFWLIDSVRETFLSYLSKEDLLSLRFVCHDFSSKTAPTLLKNLRITFKQGTFTRPSRLAALQRIGRHVEMLTIQAPHTCDSFLPPLIHPTTGEEISFMYTPQADLLPTNTEKIRHPKYGSFETADLLVKQYPPLFHSSTNVPSFIKAMSAMPNITHLNISCPSKEGKHVNHHSTVDYALISLRIAVERAPLEQLNTISYSPIHAPGLLYMQPLTGPNVPQNATKRWSQIRKMSIQMQAVDGNHAVRNDKLRMLHAYLRNFASTLTQFQFRWDGGKGPSPVSLDTEPDCCHQTELPSHDNVKHSFKALKFTMLSYMELQNAVMDATQISAFICQHHRTLEEFRFESIKLRTGNWDEALSPLSKITGNDNWKRGHKRDESMEVPIILSPTVWSGEIIQQMPHMVDRQARKSRLGSWLGQGKAARATSKAKEQLLGGSEHVKKILRASVCPWRSP